MDSVQPLRISKSSHAPATATSPNKMAASRPLAEITSTSQRRNSPSYNQATRVRPVQHVAEDDLALTVDVVQKMIVSRESSPYVENENSSPFAPSPYTAANSPLALTKMSPFRVTAAHTPDRSPSPSVSPTRRSSIERLKQASRVKNSNIFALESKDAYDPTSMPIVERPSANRPLSQQFANNSFTRFDSLKKENHPVNPAHSSPQRPAVHKRSETEIYLPTLGPTREAAAVADIALPLSPEKDVRASPSPTKSALRTSMFGLPSYSQTAIDLEHGPWSDDSRAATPRHGDTSTLLLQHRHNKSVTFHADPPTVNEYVQQTPEPSVSVGSREGSWDSASDVYEQEDYSFERGSSLEPGHTHTNEDGEEDDDDSFDADLENADKTPVVLPEDWRRMSPDTARTELVNAEDDVFDAASPSPSPGPRRSALVRSESVASDGSARPLPPLPASLAAASHQQRSDRPAHGMAHAAPEELTVTNLDTGAKMEVQVRVAEAGADDESGVGDESLVGDLSEFASAPPRISRESILRKVRGTKYDFEDDSEEEDSMVLGEEEKGRPSIAELARMHPDQPIPSRENSRETSESYLPGLPILPAFVEQYQQVGLEEQEEEVEVKPEPLDDDADGIDMAAIPAFVPDNHTDVAVPLRERGGRQEDYDRQSSVLHHRLSISSAERDADDDDAASRYSSLEPEIESTLLHAHQPATQQGLGHEEEEEGRETLMDAMGLLTVKDYSTMATAPPTQNNGVEKAGNGGFMGLPSYLGSGEYDFGMGAFARSSPAPVVAAADPAPPLSSAHEMGGKLDLAAAPVLQSTRAMWQPAPASLPMMDAISPPGSPDSVLLHRDSG
ncbi:Bud site selection protein bud4, partial [Teratosphaeriaceae sp. CCFEE 6253]